MRFADFEFIPLMLIPSVILLYLVITNKSVVERIFSPEVLRKIRLDQGMDRRMRLATLFGALFFMIVALARPVYQKGVVEVVSKRAQLVIALDVSRSMRAKDLYPNRMEFAKKKIEELIEKGETLSIGLLAFAENAFIVSPITSDKETLLYFLRRLEGDALSMHGTNIASALLSADLLFDKKGQKNLLLVTDGGEKRDFQKEIDLAKELGMRVHVLGIGTKKGAPMEDGKGYVKDEEGNIVIVRRNDAIAALAKESGGVYVPATLSGEDIQKLLRSIGGEALKKKEEKVVDQKELYHLFLIVALIFLFLAFFDLPTKGVAFALLLFGAGLQAGILDFKHIQNAKEAYGQGRYERAAKEFEIVAKEKRTPQAWYDLGNAYYRMGEYQKALESYEKVQTTQKELEFRKLHNMGNSYFKLGNYQKAVEFYQKALALKKDPDTLYNLKLARRMLKKGSGSGKERDKKAASTQKRGQEDQKSGKSRGRSAQSTQKKPQRAKNAPITDREEKKWQKRIERSVERTLLYRAPVKRAKKDLEDAHPW